ncbi:MAG: hypothetical protein QM776_13695 [Rhodocyclaceae bacterium]
MRWDIRTRVLLVALVPTAVLGMLLTAILTVSRLGDLEDALAARGQALARQLASASEFGLFSGNRDELARLAQSTLSNADLQGVAIFGRDHELLASAGLQANQTAIRRNASGVEWVGNNIIRISSAVGNTAVSEEDP